MLCLVSILTLAAISVNRLLVLSLGLRYRQVVTLRRTCLAVFAFWFVSTVAFTMHLWNYLITYWYGYIVISVCLVTSIYSYTKIFLTLCHHQSLGQGNFQAEQQSQTILLNVSRYRKAVSSALWLQLTLVVCYLPFYIVSSQLIFQSTLSLSLHLAWEFSATLVYVNSSITPFFTTGISEK